MPVGQIVGRMNEVRPVAEVMAELVAEADETLGRLDQLGHDLRHRAHLGHPADDLPAGIGTTSARRTASAAGAPR